MILLLLITDETILWRRLKFPSLFLGKSINTFLKHLQVCKTFQGHHLHYKFQLKSTAQKLAKAMTLGRASRGSSTVSAAPWNNHIPMENACSSPTEMFFTCPVLALSLAICEKRKNKKNTKKLHQKNSKKCMTEALRYFIASITDNH